MSEQFHKSGGFWGGVGLWYVVLWIFSFYPAFIVSFTLQRKFFGMDGEGGADVFCVVAMIIGTFVILGLAACRQYFIVLMMYVITAWPFLYILHHLYNCKSGQEYPLPLDWCFLF